MSAIDDSNDAVADTINRLIQWTKSFLETLEGVKRQATQPDQHDQANETVTKVIERALDKLKGVHSSTRTIKQRAKPIRNLDKIVVQRTSGRRAHPADDEHRKEGPRTHTQPPNDDEPFNNEQLLNDSNNQQLSDGEKLFEEGDVSDIELSEEEEPANGPCNQKPSNEEESSDGEEISDNEPRNDESSSEEEPSDDDVSDNEHSVNDDQSSIPQCPVSISEKRKARDEISRSSKRVAHNPPSIAGLILRHLYSHDALLQCVSVVGAYRNEAFRSTFSRDLSYADSIDQAVALTKQVKRFENKSLLHEILWRFALYKFARHLSKVSLEVYCREHEELDLEVGIMPDNLRLSRKIIPAILERQGISATSENRNKVYYHFRAGKAFIKLCEHFGEGLLLLLPTSHTSSECLPTRYYYLRAEEQNAIIDLLRSNMATISSRCQVGSDILSLFDQDSELGFEYYGLPQDFIRGLSTEELLNFLRPIKYPETDSTVSPDWPKPTNWMFEWPSDPMNFYGDNPNPCRLPCQCLVARAKSCYRIVDPASPYRCRYVVARNDCGDVVFKPGDLLEELVGEMKPIGWGRDCKMTVDYVRPDTGLTGRLYYGRRNNWTRFIEYSECPIVELVCLLLHGKMRIVFRAVQSAHDGVPITANTALSSSCDCPECKWR